MNEFTKEQIIQLQEKLSRSEDTLIQILKCTTNSYKDSEYRLDDSDVRHIRNIIRGYIEGFDIRELNYNLPFDKEVQEGLDSLNIRGDKNENN